MSNSFRRIAPLVLGVGLAAAAAAGSTFTVTNTNDNGPGSLRQAILDANANPGLDTIVFSISGAGVHTITPATPFDAILNPVLINGYSQPGSSPNTDPIADNAILTIELDGSVAGGTGLFLAGGGGSTVQGLVINRWDGGIQTFNNSGGGSSNVIRGNFIGTDPTGTLARANGTGVVSNVSSPPANDLIGGTAPADRNLISGNSDGIAAESPGATIRGNLIGTNSTGSAAVSNTHYGIVCNSLVPVIGGSAAGAGNVISGNAWGVIIGNASSNAVVQGNRIGTTADGVGPLGNSVTGIDIESGGSGITIGGTGAGEGNKIAFNAGPGVLVGSGLNNTILGNSIHDNGGLGLDLNGDGQPNFNDAGDADDGANHLQNFPIIQSVTFGGSNTTILGKLNGAASTTFDLDFYSNPACSNFPREFLEGGTYLGSAQVTTNGSGTAAINVTLPVVVAAGSKISATATDPAGNTSELSQRIIFSVSPSSGPNPGGTPITVLGTDFASPTTMTIGGVSATGVTFVDDHTLTASTPSFPPGTAQDIVVTTPDGTVGTLVKGWVSDFLDVPSGTPFHPFVTTLVSNGITAGVGGGDYGVNQPVTRAQMSVLLLRGKNGLCYVPPPATGTVFNDVPANGFAAAFIEALAASGVTTGCGPSIYCPTASVTRAQMSVFLLRTKEGQTYVPQACVTPTFNDVPCSNGFARWIEELVRRGITAGCGGGSYCPGTAVTRGQMAVFLVATLGLLP